MVFTIFKILYFYLHIFNIVTGELIPENPVKITDTPFPIVFISKAQSYNIITSGKILILKNLHLK